ncbi:MAG TPA: hypothetical protein VMV04_00880 [Thermodesulfobacteriota bacterium]|nr:hypothetical protein [Thermodesulfobacteriota bacterium]
MMISTLLLMAFGVHAQTSQTSKAAPPVAQTLIPEGDFALKLAPALGLGTPTSEAQAEDMLTSAGIAPKNGWMADYPVTPVVVGELQNAVTGAADAHKLPIGKEDALKAFENLTVEFGLAVVPGGPGQYAENQPQVDSTMIDDYYNAEGPPVVTYYPPPPYYDYLYAWVPYPFWWGGFFFTGFFCLHDFHGFHHNHLISNHFVDPVTHSVARVNPVSHALTHASHTAAGFSSATTRNSAASIFNHSANLTGGRTFSHSTSSATNSGMNHRSSQSFSRPFGSASSFSRSSGSLSSGGISSCTNCHGSGGSFGRSGGGSSFGSHSSGGFSGGHSSGGFSGGHSSTGFSGSHSSGGFSGGHGGGGHR